MKKVKEYNKAKDVEEDLEAKYNKISEESNKNDKTISETKSEIATVKREISNLKKN